MSPHPTRRTVLKGLSAATGSLVISSMVDRLKAEAAGKPLPRRFVFVVEGNGLPWQQIQPIGIERDRKSIASGSYAKRSGPIVQRPFREVDLKDHALPPALEPVTEWKDRVTVLQGLSGKMCSGGHSNDFGALGAYNARGGELPRAETIDFALGRRLGGIYPQIGLGISPKPDDTVIYNCSAAGRGKPLPTQCRPDLAFQNLFAAAADGDARRAFDVKRHVLDRVAEDIRRARRLLAGTERQKLDSYLSAFESMQQRHRALAEREQQLKQAMPAVTSKFSSDVETDRLDAHFEVAAGALIAGLTNVVTIASGVGNPYFSIRFGGLGIGVGKHTIGHGGGYKGQTAEQLAIRIRRFHFELIARLIRKLQAVPEGDGTMFDNTLIVYLSDAAEGHHSRCWEWPCVLIGHLGGRLKCGRYMEWPPHGAVGHRHIGNLYTTLLQAVGDARESFGQPDPLLGQDVDQRGPLSQLLV